MELFLPEQIALDGVSNALLGDVEETARRVNEYRPLPAKVVQRILDDLLGERVYASNAIEGNTLDLRETETILKTGKLIEKQRRESIEARNLGEAVKAISALVPGGKSAHTVDTLREIHTIVLKDDPQERGGQYRSHGVTITGAKYQPPDHTLVASLVDRVMEQLQKDSDLPAVVRAAWSHWTIARIHPFGDGNGRTARLWQDLVLFQGNLTCAIIRSEERRQYLDALMIADEGDFNSLVQLVANRVLSTFGRYLAALGEDPKTREFIRDLFGEVKKRDERKQEHENRRHSRKLEYARWCHKWERLRFEFEILIAQINKILTGVRMQIIRYEIVDFEDWDHIDRMKHPGNFRYFDLEIHNEAKKELISFEFRRGHNPEAETQICLSNGFFGHIYEVDGDEDSEDCRELRLTELCVVHLIGDRFVVHGQPAVGNEKKLEPSEVAQMYIRRLVLHHLD